MKRIARLILGCLCFASIILAGGETPDGGIDILWTLFWIAVAYLCGRYYGKLEKISDEGEDDHEDTITLEEVQKSFPDLKEDAR